MQAMIQVPVRVCDVGGWTDTWFAGHGRVCNLAVEPGVSVAIRAEPGSGRVAFELVDYGLEFTVGAEPPEHRLLAAAVREAGGVGPVDAVLRITSAVPPGSSLGTSAAVCVGVVAALDAVRRSARSPAELAAAAHRAEVGRLGRESGVQDQVSSAHGGASLIEIDEYPHAVHERLQLSPATSDALDRQLVHVAYGSPHDSSAVHQEVIATLEREGHSAPRLTHLRTLATEAGDALRIGDLDRYGQILTAATDGQGALHEALLSNDARQLIDLACQHNAIGWKVNGAGGEGGSISILCRGEDDRRRVAAAAADLGHRPLDLVVAPFGARVADR